MPPATVADFKARFDRDFFFGKGFDTVRDGDVQNALDEAQSSFNAGLWKDAAEGKRAFLLLSAHVLALNLQAAGGLSFESNAPVAAGAESQGDGPVQSKSVGGVSVTFLDPEKVTKSPALAPFLRTAYGRRYLEMAAPRLAAGGISVVAGFSEPDRSPQP